MKIEPWWPCRRVSRSHAMSAAVIGQLLSACAGAYSAVSSAVWWAASLPPTCKESLTHAALTCSGATPRYFTPGFGPLALAWGWLLLGILLGLLFRRAAATMVALAGGHPADGAPHMLGGTATRAVSPHTGPTQARGVTLLAARGRSSGARVVASDEPHTRSADSAPPKRQHFCRRCCGPAPNKCAHAPTQRAAVTLPQQARGHARWQAPGLGDVRNGVRKWTPHPHCGRRVGLGRLRTLGRRPPTRSCVGSAACPRADACIPA